MDTLELLKKIPPVTGKVLEEIKEVKEKELETPKIDSKKLIQSFGGPGRCKIVGELKKVEKKVVVMTEFYEKEMSRSFRNAVNKNLKVALHKQGLMMGLQRQCSEEVQEISNKIEVLFLILLRLCQTNHEDLDYPVVVSKDFRFVHLSGLKQKSTFRKEPEAKRLLKNNLDLLRLNKLIMPQKKELY